MRTIVIADGLTKDFLGAEQPFAAEARNVGRAEIDRLLGRGKAYGEGPLPAFLRAASESDARTAGSQVVLLRGDSPLPEILEPLIAGAEVISSDPDVIPWSDLWGVIGENGPGGFASGEDAAAERRFILMGCHTEGRILALATFLCVGLGYKEIAVSPHLVGSATREAHLAAFRHHFPNLGVKVLLDLAEVAAYAGIESAALASLECRPPELGLDETRGALNKTQRRILELLCLNWTRAELRPLAGGFSGSLLLLANGWKGGARTEPSVLKVDGFAQMRRELEGYHRVKDFLGKHVPTFGYPVAEQDALGVSMELAAMEGNPQTLQDTFEEAENDEGLNHFLARLEKSLTLLSDKLYRNTRETTWVVPYRAFGLHAEKQARWLVENAELIGSYLGDDLPSKGRVDPEKLAKLLRLISANPDGIDSEVCVGHGDLNYANVICDEVDNIWFIDWTHSDYAPLELDFAKLENDVKFVMSKMFDADDLARLRLIEEYLLEQRIPGDADSLPERLKFAKWDLRFRRILETVRRIRRACFDLKSSEDWLVYRVALLRYATHTLSFDKCRDRGECDPPQLMHALYSVEALIYNLVADDFHLRIRAERPESYPPRQRISIDEAPWMLDCDDYDPPYYVSPVVLENDRSKIDNGWADPEDFGLVRDLPRVADAKYSDDGGKPLNPRGRTGLAGRGLLGLWGPNLSVQVLVARENPDTGKPEILLGGTESSLLLEVPKGFVLPDESTEEAVERVLSLEAGWDPGRQEVQLVSEGYTYDSRQTDNAWVETQAFLVLPEAVPTLLTPGVEFDEIKWRPLDAETVNRVPSDQARLIRESIPRLVESTLLDAAAGDQLLASTG
jgi:ADP-ribose pyrophosphatase